MVDINRINPEDPGTIKKILDDIALLKKQIRELPDTLPPERGLAQTTRQGYMSKEQVVALNAASVLVAAHNANFMAWAALAFQANWGNFGGTFRLGQYMRDSQGWVHLRGLVTKSTAIAANDVITVLGVGYRPTLTDSFETTKQTAGVNSRVELRVDNAGNVYTTEAMASGSLVWLNSIHFDPAP